MHAVALGQLFYSFLPFAKAADCKQTMLSMMDSWLSVERLSNALQGSYHDRL